MSSNNNNSKLPDRNPETGERYKRNRPHQEERYREMSADKKREVRTEERQHKKDMKRSMSYFQNVGNALKDADADTAVHVVEGFSTELIRKLRNDFSLLYRSSTICKIIEKALSSGATRAHVDALFYIVSGHIRELLSVPKTSFLIETLFTAIYHSVGLECSQRGGASHLEDVLETPSAASTPSLKQLLENFDDEICHEFSSQGLDWLYARSAARGFASIIKSLSGIPSRGAPEHKGINFSFAVVPISRALKRSFLKTPQDTLQAAMDPSFTFVIQALLKCPQTSETWLRDLTTEDSIQQLLHKESGVRVLEAAMEADSSLVTPLVLDGFKQKQQNDSEQNDHQGNKKKNQQKKNSEDAAEDEEGQAAAAAEEEVVDTNSLFIIANVISNTPAHADVLQLWKQIIKPKLASAITSGREYSALAKAMKRIASIQGAGLTKPVKEIRTDIVHDILEACKESYELQQKNKKQEGGGATDKKNPLLLLFQNVSFENITPAAFQEQQRDAAASAALNANFKAGTTALEFLDSILALGLAPSSMLVHSWEKIPVEKLRQMASCNLGSRALQMLVPHIAATRLTGKQITNPADAVVDDVLDEESKQNNKDNQQQQNSSSKAVRTNQFNKFNNNNNAHQQLPYGGKNPRFLQNQNNQQHHQHQKAPVVVPEQKQQPQLSPNMVLQPGLQKLLRRLTNSEIGDVKGRSVQFPTFKSLICNTHAAFLIQKIYDECALWLKQMIVRRIAKLMESDDECKGSLAAKKFSLHCRVDQFNHRPSEWLYEAEKTAGAKKLMSVILAAEN